MRIALAVTLCLLCGCSSISYYREVDRVAAAEIDAAKKAGAPTRAPYFYALAVAYLERARAYGARSDYDSARLFGGKAIDAAGKARRQLAKGTQP